MNDKTKQRLVKILTTATVAVMLVFAVFIILALGKLALFILSL